MDIAASFSDFISENLIREGINTLEFSKKINIEHSIIYRWVNGRYLPRVDSLIKISDYFHVSIDYMLGLSEIKPLIRAISNQGFNSRLRELLKAKNISTYKLANECDVGKAAISKLLLGQSKYPKTDNLVSIAKYFDCSVDYLIGRADIL